MAQKRHIKRFLLDNLSHHKKDIINTAVQRFGLSRQAILKHMQTLIKDNQVIAQGRTKDRIYQLSPRVNFTKEVKIDNNIDVSELIKTNIIPHLNTLSDNICEIVYFSMNAIMSNVKDHSKATKSYFKLFLNHDDLNIVIADNGIGIFKNIKSNLKLPSAHIAAIELAKSGLTTDPKNHSGDELYTVFHLFDNIKIESTEILLHFDYLDKSWNINQSKQANGTRIHLKINPSSKRTCLDIFKKIFNSKQKTLSIPISLTRYGGLDLINSREQANYLLRNIEDYKIVNFDFKNIDLIGPAFADELIRKTNRINKSIIINWVNSNDMINIMLKRALQNIS